MIITTARKGADQLKEKAQSVCQELEGTFVEREEHSVNDLISRFNEDVLVVGKNRLTLYSTQGGEPFFYHPNSAMFRIKQFKRSGYDPFVVTAGLKEGMTLLDCTMGLASDSLVASVVVGGNGQVVGLEANKALASIVRDGLQTWQDGHVDMLDAMQRINVIHTHHKLYLENLPNNSFDVVYFDPMFETHISRSTGIKGLKQFACHDDLTAQIIEEAIRVASFRVVLKDHYLSERFEKFGFTVLRRQNASFHYGYIENLDV